MIRTITGFHPDDEGEWVAELDCGHNQHVRHRPPFQERPWVVEAEGRAGRVGTPLPCPLCDRAELPDGLRPAGTSPEWNETTLPPGLRRDHRLASGTWGRIVLRSGGLRFTLAGEPPLEAELAGEGATQAIPPGMAHHVEPVGEVRLAIDFLTVDRSVAGTAEAGEPEPATAQQAGDPACWAGLLCPECGIVLDGSPHRPGCPAGESG